MYLDFVAYPDLGPTIRAFKTRIKSPSSASLELTTIAPSIPFLSDDFVLCSLPFMPRKYLKDSIPRRTSTPLLTTLHSVTQYLSLGNPKTTIVSITNVTNEQVAALRISRQKLITDRAIRSGLITEWGENEWREHIFLLDWEAGLLAAGLLTRWSIVIRK
ncbi:hypothetical protein D9615_001535 [Tricholomella constricta]|uniref:Uncharacterized protein n=1 Tax=Tricholomella constricta TaxID=117010 RepID=A0A8H5HNN8_9AGAR|nr:hypothetical protein D9615_001535 [Tricholomella constricta]